MSGQGFFDMREKLIAPRRAAAAAQSSAAPAGEAISVTQVTALVDRAIKAGMPASVLVRGEVSNFNYHRASGHAYFTLKDAGACINGVMFRGDFERVKFKPADGMELIVGGNVRVFAAQGKYQLYATTMHPLGQGALELAFQQMRAKLEAEGLFDAERKKPLPRFPARIALITSQGGAALQDMLKVLRRFPWVRLMLYHTPVQGDGCGVKIADAINHLNRHLERLKVDVILLGRGGGSLEDLWGFNEEAVARAVAASRVPVITGIGHEVDVSIADLVADYHAHTPTEAAQVVTADWRTARDTVDAIGLRLSRELRQIVQESRQRLLTFQRHELFRRPTDRIDSLRQLLDVRQRDLAGALGRRLADAEANLLRSTARLAAHHPRSQIAARMATLDALSGRLTRGAKENLRRCRDGVDAQARYLEAISPISVLKRGYSVTRRKKDGAILHSAEDVKPGDRLVTRFSDGEVESVAEDPKQPGLF